MIEKARKWRERVGRLLRASALRGRSVRRRIFICMQPILLMLVLAVGLLLFLIVGQTHETLIALAEAVAASALDPDAALSAGAEGAVVQTVALFALMTVFGALLFMAHAAFTERAVAQDDVAISETRRLEEKKSTPKGEAEDGANAEPTGAETARQDGALPAADAVVSGVRQAVSALFFATPWIWLVLAAYGARAVVLDRSAAAAEIQARLPGAALGGFTPEALGAVLTALWAIVGLGVVVWAAAWFGARGWRRRFSAGRGAGRPTKRLILVGLIAFVAFPLLSPVWAYGFFTAIGPYAAPLTALFVVFSLLIYFGFLRTEFEQPYSIILLGFIVAILFPQVDWEGTIGWTGILFFGALIAVIIGFIAFGFGVSARWSMGAAAVISAAFGWFAYNAYDAPSQNAARLDPTAPAPPLLETVFAEWLIGSEPVGEGAARRRPVFIVSARGGGAYAAAAASSLLSKLECAAPGVRFHDHLFVVSSVSGGSVGSVMFRDLMRSPVHAAPCADPAALERIMLGVLTENHVGASLAALPADQLGKIVVSGATVLNLTVMNVLGLDDPLQVPAASYTRFRGLSRSFMDAQRAARGGAWEARGGREPYLILNTTWSETGFRVAYAAFSLRPISDQTLFSFDDLAPYLAPFDASCPTQARNVGALFDAQSGVAPGGPAPRGVTQEMEKALASAAFPLMLPAHVRCRRTDPAFDGLPPVWNFVDGGYSDSTGAITAAEVAVALQEFVAECRAAPAEMTPQERLDACEALQRAGVDLSEIEIHLIILTDDRPSPDNLEAVASGTRLRDSGAIISAVLNIRALNSNVAAPQAIELVSASDPGPLAPPIAWYEVRIGNEIMQLPLGWTLSSASARMIGASIGDPAWLGDAADGSDWVDFDAACQSIEALDAVDGLRARCAAALVERNSCVLWDIAAVLSAEPGVRPRRCPEPRGGASR